jgi:hypothetical protein
MVDKQNGHHAGMVTGTMAVPKYKKNVFLFMICFSRYKNSL